MNLGNVAQAVGNINNTVAIAIVTGGASGIFTVGGNNGSGTYIGVMSGTGGLTKVGTGTLTLSSANTYSGTTTVSAGTLSISGSINSSTVVNVNGSTLSTTGADMLADTAAITVTGGTLTVGGADTVGTLAMSSGAIGGSSTLTASTYGLSGGTVTGNLGAGTLNSSGTVALNGIAGAGTVNITAGTLTLGSANRLSDSAAVNVSGGTLAIGANSDTVGAVTLSSGSITGSGGTLTGSSYDVQSGSISAILGGAGIALTKTTAGTVTLTGANIYGGGTTISGGTLQIGSGGSITGSVLDNGNLAFNRSGSTFSGNISGSGTVTQAGTSSATLTLSGNNSYDGVTFINAGAIAVGSATALGSTVGDTEVASGASLAFIGGVSLTTSEPIQIAGAGSSSYSGAIDVRDSSTVVCNGPVTLAGDSTLAVATGSTVTFNNSSAFTSLANQNLTLTGAGSGTISGALNLGSGGLTKLQGGTWTLSGANTYSGATTVSVGKLLVNNSTGSGTGSGSVTVQTTATLGGGGFVGGPVTINSGGFVAPGNSVGTLTVNNDCTVSGTYNCEVDGTAGTSDLLAVSGTLTVSGGTLAISVSGTPTAGAYVIATYGTLSGTFATVTGVPTGYTLVYSYLGNQIAIVQKPIISVGPVAQTVTYGSDANFSVTATGPGTLSYQWKKNGSNVGANSSSLTLVNPLVSDSGASITVDVSNVAGTTTSSPATLTVNALVASLTGTRAYDGTADAAAAILSVANKVGSDDVTVASGSGTLASAAIGLQSITSLGSLALGGTAAGNYTLSGASGSVTITSGLVAPTISSNSAPHLTLKIEKAPLLAAWGKPSGDTLSISGVTSPTSGGGTVSLGGGSFIFYTPPGGSPASDTITYAVQDVTSGSTSSGIITINFVAPGGLAQSIAYSPSGVTVVFAGIPGVDYDVERAEDVNFTVNLTTLQTITAPAGGIFSVFDSDPPNPTGYYRTKQH